MFMQKNPEQCQVVVALDMIVGKWKPMILLYLMNEGTKRFSELKRLLPDITPRMLTLQLRELEAHDIIERKVYPEVPPRVEYSMTEYGRTLEPILEAMHEWGKAHLEHMKAKHARQSEGVADPSGKSGR